MSFGAQRVLAQLPAALSLDLTCAGFPHVVEKLLNHWHDPPEFRRVMDSMLIDSRGGRIGFPFEVLLELSALREHYDLNVHALKTTAWSSVTSR